MEWILLAMTSLLGICSFLFVRWMNKTDEEIENCQDENDKHDKRLFKIENQHISKHDFNMTVKKLENADIEQKKQIYQLDGAISSLQYRVKNLEKENRNNAKENG